MTLGLQVIVGLGKTGLSCLRYLMTKNCQIGITDSRENPPGLEEIKTHFPSISLSLGQFDTALCAKADCLIVSPGVSLQEPAIVKATSKGVPAIGDIELFAHEARAPIIAITGSNGKSTVTTMVGEMARAAGLNVRVGGNLGTPALELLSKEEPDLYVLELSSFQLETTYALKTAAATILNISEDHMDRYASLTDYLHAKQRIYHHCTSPIINRDDPKTWQNLHLPTPVSFGLDVPTSGNFGLRQKNGQSYLAYGDTYLIPTNELKIKGRHQVANALAALALGHTLYFSMTTMLDVLLAFQGLTHRCQWVANYGGVDWYNDSKATNMGAAYAALEGLGADTSGKLIVIAGGQGKNADFSTLRTPLKKYARLLILIGEDAPIMETVLKGSTSIQRSNSLQDAVELAHSQAKPGDVVILCPACASFDMFNNFEHRGDLFMTAVRSLV